jgi:hypothetical protein
LTKIAQRPYLITEIKAKKFKKGILLWHKIKRIDNENKVVESGESGTNIQNFRGVSHS